MSTDRGSLHMSQADRLSILRETPERPGASSGISSPMDVSSRAPQDEFLAHSPAEFVLRHYSESLDDDYKFPEDSMREYDQSESLTWSTLDGPAGEETAGQAMEDSMDDISQFGEEAAGQPMEDSMDDISQFEFPSQRERERMADHQTDVRTGSVSTVSENGLVTEPELRILESKRQVQSYSTKPTWECHGHDHIFKYVCVRLEEYQRSLESRKEFQLMVKRQQPKQKEIIRLGISPTCDYKHLDKHAFILDPQHPTSSSTTDQRNQSDTGYFCMNPQSKTFLHSIKDSDKHVCTVEYIWAWKPGKSQEPTPESTCEIKVWGYIIPTAEEVETLNRKDKKSNQEALKMMTKRKAPRLCIPLPEKRLSENLRRCHIDEPQSAQKHEEEMKINIAHLIVTTLVERHPINCDDPALQEELNTASDKILEELKKICESKADQLFTKVKGGLGWPDYVFEKEFILPTVIEVLKKAMALGHLPGVISASEIVAGKFCAEREVASVLKYVEMQLRWICELRQGQDKMESRLQFLEESMKGTQKSDSSCSPNPELVRGAAERLGEVMEAHRDIADEVNEKWEWTCKHELYWYQEEGIRRCFKENTICCIPTGKGKTLIAVGVTDLFLDYHPTKNVMFVVPTQALVKQQAEYIRKHSERPSRSGSSQSLRVAEVCGWDMNRWQESDWGKCVLIHRVLVGTPETFRVALVDTMDLDISKFCLIIFDECHNATGNSPMAQIARDCVHKCSTPPRIMGLTGSFVNGSMSTPVRNRDKLESLLQSNMWSPEIDPDEKHYTLIEWQIESGMDKWMETCDLVMEDLVLSKLTRLIKNKDSRRALQHSSHVLTQLGAHGFYHYLKSGIVPRLSEIATKLMQADGCDPHISGCGRRLMETLPQIEKVLQDAEKSIKNENRLKEIPAETHKLKKLIALLIRLKKEKGQLKGILFVDQKCLVYPLCLLLNEREFQVEPAIGSTEMTQKRRGQSLTAFRENKLDLLVSTTVLEEGIDVPDCEIVIRFNKFDTTKSHIQGSGRGRAYQAQIFYFDNDPEIEQRNAALMDRISKDTSLNLSPEEKQNRIQRVASQKYPYKPESTAEVNWTNCTKLLTTFCSKTMRQSVSPDQLSSYSFETIRLHPLETRRILRCVQYPTPSGYEEMKLEEVDAYWGDDKLEAFLDRDEYENLQQSERETRRFHYCVVVRLRQLGHLDSKNRPSESAIEKVPLHCAVLPRESNVNIRPLFSEQRTSDWPSSSDRTLDSSSVCTETQLSDFVSALNLHSQKERHPPPRYDFASDHGQFIATVSIPGFGDITGNRCGSKQEAKQSAAAKATQQIQLQRSVSAPGGSHDASPETNHKSRLSEMASQKWKTTVGVIKYDTVSTSEGFVSTVTLSQTGEMWEGETKTTKKSAEADAARVALLSWTGASSDLCLLQSSISDRTLDSSSVCTETQLSDFVSALNLHCQKERHPPPRYDFASDHGQFIATVSIPGLGDITGNRCGSKQEAKQSAAAKATQQMQLLQSSVSDRTLDSSSVCTETQLSDFVSALNLHCQKERHPPPRYDFASDHGQFIATVSIPGFGDITGNRCGSKQEAKQSAAAKATQQIQLQRSVSAPGGSHDASPETNHKSRLSEMASQKWKTTVGVIKYDTVSTSEGFVSTVTLSQTGEMWEGETKTTKKSAEADAARVALLSWTGASSDFWHS